MMRGGKGRREKRKVQKKVNITVGSYQVDASEFYIQKTDFKVQFL